MRKFLFLAVLCPFLGFSQFVLTPNGMVDEKDETKNYVVFEFENKNASELYSSVLATLTKSYVSAKDVISKVENKTISLNGTEKNAICYGGLGKGCNLRYDLNYTFYIDFKDNKIKVNGLSVMPTEGSNISNNHSYQLAGGGIFARSTFDKDGKVRDKKSKESIEAFFNGLVKIIVDNLNNEQKEDW